MHILLCFTIACDDCMQRMLIFYHQLTNSKRVHIFSVKQQQFYVAPAMQQPNNVVNTPLGGYLKKKKKCYKRLQSLFENHIVQELCESRGGRPGLSILTSLLVSVDIKLY